MGATSGRVLVGLFDGERLTCEEVHRFRNEPVQVSGSLYWDILRLFQDVKHGLRRCASEYGPDISALGVDTWGADFGLIDRNGDLVGNPYHCRDKRTEGIAEEITSIINGYELYTVTGVKLADTDTICQLYSMVKQDSPQLKIAEFFLLIPCLLNYFLSGSKRQEHSVLTMTSLYDVVQDAPATRFLDRLGIPIDIMPDIVRPGAVIGRLRAQVSEETGLGAIPVVAPATHDTASAVLSVPADDNTNWAFLSSGTWSVLGIETERPITTRLSYDMGMTNASTAEGKFMPRFNIVGLWILEECKRIWEASGTTLEYRDMVGMARQAQPFSAFIDVDDGLFMRPVDMPKAIVAYCEGTSQSPPEDRGTIVRVALEGLALKYKDALRRLETVTSRKIEVLHIVGGGGRNELLSQFTANATGIPVLTGPFEATSMGNMLAQMVGTGEIDSTAQGRALLRRSLDLTEYMPEDVSGWDEAYEKYQSVVGRNK